MSRWGQGPNKSLNAQVCTVPAGWVRAQAEAGLRRAERCRLGGIWPGDPALAPVPALSPSPREVTEGRRSASLRPAANITILCHSVLCKWGDGSPSSGDGTEILNSWHARALSQQSGYWWGHCWLLPLPISPARPTGQLPGLEKL